MKRARVLIDLKIAAMAHLERPRKPVDYEALERTLIALGPRSVTSADVEAALEDARVLGLLAIRRTTTGQRVVRFLRPRRRFKVPASYKAFKLEKPGGRWP